jgi:hypothetical protein
MRYSNNSIKVGDITNATGVAIGPGARASVTQVRSGMSDEVAMAFAALRQQVNALPGGPVQVVAKSAIDVLEAEAAKGERAKESNVSRWLDFLAQAAPDVWEVAVDTFLNPIKGLSTAFQKIAERAKAEKNGRRDHG